MNGDPILVNSVMADNNFNLGSISFIARSLACHQRGPGTALEQAFLSITLTKWIN